jgi:DNA-binding IclR family transcriptional regulator
MTKILSPAKPNNLVQTIERVSQTSHMVIYDRNEIVYIEKIEAQQPAGGLKMASRVGSCNPTARE